MEDIITLEIVLELVFTVVLTLWAFKIARKLISKSAEDNPSVKKDE